MSQTTTPAIDLALGFAGMLASGPRSHRISSSFSIANQVIGRLVCFDQPNGDDAVKTPAAAGDITNYTKGIILHSHAHQEQTDDANPIYPAKASFSVLREGHVVVEVEDAVAAGEPVFARNNGANAGAFRSDADTGNATQVPTAKFVTSTTGAGLAVVSLNLD